jgi:hypothetical protein
MTASVVSGSSSDFGKPAIFLPNRAIRGFLSVIDGAFRVESQNI